MSGLALVVTGCRLCCDKPHGHAFPLSAPSEHLEARKAEAQGRARLNELELDLRGLPSPLPPDLGRFVRDTSAAVALGKAFFWDIQAGSDEKTSCATCHHHAGADTRHRNTLWALRPESFPHGSNFTWTAGSLDAAKASDRLLAKNSTEVVGSAGVTLMKFLGLKPGANGEWIEDSRAFTAEELTTAEFANEQARMKLFGLAGGQQLRHVTPRNTPSVGNAIFNDRQFHDGRAANVFNGYDIFGEMADEYPVGKWRYCDGRLEKVTLSITNASLASQAVGPPVNNREMFAAGEKTPVPSTIGASADQPHRQRPGTAFENADRQLIEKAFRPEWWSCPPEKLMARETFGEKEQENHYDYTQMEANFSLFWGLSILLYESTLVSDDSPFDRFARGDTSALSAEARRGFATFKHLDCASCHALPETSEATLSHLRGPLLEAPAVNPPGTELIELMKFGTNPVTKLPYDAGYYNLGVTPTSRDMGIHESLKILDPDALRLPRLSAAATAASAADDEDEKQQRATILTTGDRGQNPRRRFQAKLAATNRPAVEREVFFSLARRQFGDAARSKGAFKSSILRNLEITPPYMHNGGLLTLEQVMTFYNNGGDFDNRGFKHPEMAAMEGELSSSDQRDLVAFLKSLTDERVRRHLPPFDHPSLPIPNGHNVADGQWSDLMETIPATGREGLVFPTFEERARRQ